ncbi:hypothetical protein AB0D40_31985 [Streptomyces massasporeus]|uniref:hypothetical protein n=1 Tax=Streptomyces massasporeus TaxID=67324 RepID=UPI0033D4A970
MTTPNYGNTPPGSQFRAGHEPLAWNLDPAAQQQRDPSSYSVGGPMPGPPRDACAVCGGLPAAHVDVRAHRGLVIRMQWETISDWLCSTCGIALIRRMTTRTLWQGWWGVGSLLIGAPYTLVQNLRAYRRLRQLPLATPALGRAQADLGKPVLERPLAYVALIPLAWATWLVTNLLTR